MEIECLDYSKGRAGLRPNGEGDSISSLQFSLLWPFLFSSIFSIMSLCFEFSANPRGTETFYASSEQSRVLDC